MPNITRSKQQRANRIERWLRLGPIFSSVDERTLHPGEKFYRRCICGLTYAKSNWLYEGQVNLGVLYGVVFTVLLVWARLWFIFLIMACLWLLMTIAFLLIGHSLSCSLRRPPVSFLHIIGVPPVG
jgi:hypothetical protein